MVNPLEETCQGWLRPSPVRGPRADAAAELTVDHFQPSAESRYNRRRDSGLAEGRTSMDTSSLPNYPTHRRPSLGAGAERAGQGLSPRAVRIVLDLAAVVAIVAIWWWPIGDPQRVLIRPSVEVIRFPAVR